MVETAIKIEQKIKYNNFTEELKESLKEFLNIEGLEQIDLIIIKSLLSTIDEYEEIENQIDTLNNLLADNKILEDNAIVNTHGEISRLMIIRAELKDKITKNLLGLKRLLSTHKKSNESNDLDKYIKTMKIVNPEEL